MFVFRWNTVCECESVRFFQFIFWARRWGGPLMSEMHGPSNFRARLLLLTVTINTVASLKCDNFRCARIVFELCFSTCTRARGKCSHLSNEQKTRSCQTKEFNTIFGFLPWLWIEFIHTLPPEHWTHWSLNLFVAMRCDTVQRSSAHCSNIHTHCYGAHKFH